MDYPRPEKITLIVRANLEITTGTLLNYTEDWGLSPRLRPVESPSNQIRKYEVIAGTPWLASDEETVLRDDRLKLGTIRLTALPGDETETVIKRGYWETNDQRDYLTTEKHLELYRQFFDRLIDLLVKRYGAMGERVIDTGRLAVEKRIPIVAYTKEIIHLDVARFGNETLQRFSRWLVQYLVYAVRLREFPTGNGCYYTLDCYLLDEDKTLSHLHPDGPGLEIKGYFHTQDGEAIGDRWVIRFKALQPTPRCVPVVAECREPAVMEFFHEVVGEMKAWSPPPGGQQSMGRPSKPNRTKRGPTIKTWERGKVFKRLKDAHPEWSYYRVALEASEELGETVTGETVRNVYRAMDWEWERADRVR